MKNKNILVLLAVLFLTFAFTTNVSAACDFYSNLTTSVKDVSGSFTCTVSGTEGIDDPTNTEGSTTNSSSLTLSGGAVLIANGGTLATNRVSLSGNATLTIQEGGQIKPNAPVYVTDADGDAYPASWVFYTATAAGRRRLGLMRAFSPSNVDCNDSSFNQSNLCTPGKGGTGTDGNVTFSADTNINTTNTIAGRSCADGGDAVNYSVTALTANTATLSTTPSAGCLAAGDELMLINLQGVSAANGNVGNYEFLYVSSVSTNTITFTTNKTKYYGTGTGTNDLNLGTAITNQRVMLQRVPNYGNVTINNGVTVTGAAYNRAKGGVVAFRSNGTLTNNGTISANSLGFAGGIAATSGPESVGGITTPSGGASGGSGVKGTGICYDTTGNKGTAGGGGGGGAAGVSVCPAQGVSVTSGTAGAAGAGGGGGGAGAGGDGCSGPAGVGGIATNNGAGGGGGGAGRSCAGTWNALVNGGVQNGLHVGAAGGGTSYAPLESSKVNTKLILGAGASQGAGAGGGGGKPTAYRDSYGAHTCAMVTGYPTGGTALGAGGTGARYVNNTGSCPVVTSNGFGATGNNGGNGNPGGGIIYLGVNTLTNNVTGGIVATGGAGGIGGAGVSGSVYSNVAGSGGGGGGSGGNGGTIIIDGVAVGLGTNGAQSAGGTGGNGGTGHQGDSGGAATTGGTGATFSGSGANLGTGGNGGLSGTPDGAGGGGAGGKSGLPGIVHVFYSSSLSGTSTPTLTSTNQ